MKRLNARLNSSIYCNWFKVLFKYSRILICSLLIVAISSSHINSQNNALVLNGAYITLSGGSSSTPIYLVVNQTHSAGIHVNSGHIISEGDYNFVKWNMGATNATYVYPFGFSTTDYIPFTFNKTGGDANIAISTYGTGNPNTPLPNTVTNMNPSGPSSDALDMVVDRFWRIQVENGVSSPSGDLTFSYRGGENTIAGINCPTDIIAAQYWNTNTSNWIAPPINPGSNCVTSGIGTAQANSVNVFGTFTSQPFVLVKKTSFLPVELLSFATECINRNVMIKWSTASEINNDFFMIEKSTDEINFVPVGIVKGVGNSSVVQHYSFIDTDPFQGTSYYRLKQTDFNGITQTFSSVSISSCSSGGLSINIGQNYGDDDFWISISGADNDNFTVVVVDAFGQQLFSKFLSGITGSYLLKERLTLASGVYVVNVNSGNEFFSKKLIRVR